MAITLVEAAKLQQNPLVKGIQETFIQASPVLDRLPWDDILGNALSYNEEQTLPGIAFRGVNEAYVESTGTFNQKTESLKILGGDADVDTFIQLTGSDLNDQRAAQTALKVKALSYEFQKEFILGDTDANAKGFDGLQKRLVGKQVIDAGENGLPVIGTGTDADLFAFFDKLDELLAAVPGINGTNGAMYTNAGILQKIGGAARRLKVASVIEEDISGKRTIMWNGVPIHDLGSTPAGVPILQQTETIGSAEDTSSIYAVRFGNGVSDRAVTGLTNGGVKAKDLGELQEKPVYRTRIEWFTGLAVFGGKAAARLRGVQNR